MTQKHTKAPWKFSYMEGDKSSEIVAKSKHVVEPIAVIPHDDITEKGEKEVLANAHLIAAAPELLAALERCYEVFNMDEADTSISLQCGMAISKAKGGAA